MGEEEVGAGILRRLTKVDRYCLRHKAETDDLIDWLLAAEEEWERVVGMAAGVVVWGSIRGSFLG